MRTGPKAERVAAKETTEQHFIWATFSPWGERRDTLRAPTLSCEGATSDATPLAGTAASSRVPGSAARGLEITREQAGEGQMRREHWGQGIPSEEWRVQFSPALTLPAQSH